MNIYLLKENCLLVCLAYLFKEKIRNFSSIGVARKVKLNLHKFTLSGKEMEASKQIIQITCTFSGSFSVSG